MSDILPTHYPKSKRPRRFALEPELVAALVEHISAHALGADDLLLTFAMFDSETRTRPALIDVTDLGLTEPNAAGRQYRHGTTSAYTAGKCRCTHCRAAFARYRAERRAEGLDNPRGERRCDTDLEGHLSRDWFRNHIWYPSCDAAGLSDPRPRLHDLRHSHASWLLAGGADLQVVKERMGHGSILSTEKYLRTLPTADATALAALRRIKRPS
ncbi:MAG: tyrosine-type recombinase/integrase [Pseudonocardiales bacterium]